MNSKVIIIIALIVALLSAWLVLEMVSTNSAAESAVQNPVVQASNSISSFDSIAIEIEEVGEQPLEISVTVR